MPQFKMLCYLFAFNSKYYFFIKFISNRIHTSLHVRYCMQESQEKSKYKLNNKFFFIQTMFPSKWVKYNFNRKSYIKLLIAIKKAIKIEVDRHTNLIWIVDELKKIASIVDRPIYYELHACGNGLLPLYE